jgi:hypothetical protein
MASKKTEEQQPAAATPEPGDEELEQLDVEHLEAPGVDYAALRALRLPFPDRMIGKLPRGVQKGDTVKGKCEPSTGRTIAADGVYCGGWHVRSVHLDFVGHAALTARLLDADPTWSWEPVAWAPSGLPMFDQNGGLWIRLTVGGVTRLGYGDAGDKKGPNAVKEVIGDALRNASMRFGAALDLWHKGDLYETKEEQGKVAVETGPAASSPKSRSRTKPAPAPEPEERPMALESTASAPSDPADPGHPIPPQGWEERVASAPTLDALQWIYEEAARDGWFDKMIVAPVFTARKKKLEAQRDAAQSQVAGAFNQNDPQ